MQKIESKLNDTSATNVIIDICKSNYHIIDSNKVLISHDDDLSMSFIEQLLNEGFTISILNKKASLLDLDQYTKINDIIIFDTKTDMTHLNLANKIVIDLNNAYYEGHYRKYYPIKTIVNRL